MFENGDNIFFDFCLFIRLQGNPDQKRETECQQRRGEQIEETCDGADDEEKQADIGIDSIIVVAKQGGTAQSYGQNREELQGKLHDKNITA